MPKRIALTVNPRAGKGRSVKVADRLSHLLRNENILFEIFTNEWPADFSGFTDAWVIGGDGTINYFINQYPSLQIPISVFKGGTGNDFAWKLYDNIALDDQFKKLLSCQPRHVDAASCNGRLFLNTVGIGFDGEVLKAISAIRYIGGHIGYYLAVVKKIFLFKEKDFHITAGGLSLAGKFLIVAIANSSRTGGGFYISPASSVDDGLLDMVLVKPLGVIKRLLHLGKVQKGKHLRLPFVSHSTGRSFRVECDTLTAAQVDGEYIAAKSFDISVLPGRFLFRY